MAITIDYATLIISIPKVDTQLVDIGPPEIRQLNIDNFRLTLKDLEDDELGMPFLHTHNHNPPVTVGGVTLARVFEIINGYTITFEDGQYAVNLVGANSNIADVTNVNQVSIRSANSAGLTFSTQIENSAYEDARVWIDTVNGTAGTQYPRGTISDPVDSLVDAQGIVSARTLPKRLQLRGTLNLSALDDISDYSIASVSTSLATIVATSGVDTTGAVMEYIDLSGDMSGAMSLNSCIIGMSVTGFEGKMFECGLTCDITCIGTQHDFINCHSAVPGQGRPVVDFNSITPVNAQFRGYHGGLTIKGLTNAVNNLSVDLDAGRLELDSSCTNGAVVVRGVGDLIDNSGPLCTVDSAGLNDPSTVVVTTPTWTEAEKAEHRYALGMSGTKIKTPGGTLRHRK